MITSIWVIYMFISLMVFKLTENCRVYASIQCELNSADLVYFSRFPRILGPTLFLTNLSENIYFLRLTIASGVCLQTRITLSSLFCQRFTRYCCESDTQWLYTLKGHLKWPLTSSSNFLFSIWRNLEIQIMNSARSSCPSLRYKNG